MKLILSFLILLLISCGKSSDQKTFPIPKNIPSPNSDDSSPTPANPLTPVESTTVMYSFPNYYEDNSNLSSQAYYVQKDTNITLPQIITSFNYLNSSEFFVILGNTSCHYQKNTSNQYVSTNCISSISLKKQDAVFIYGIPFGSIVSIEIKFN